jgi:hypothetical protein
VTTRDDQRPAQATKGNDTATSTHRQQDEPSTSDAPNAVPTQSHSPHQPRDTATTDISAGSQPRNPRLAAYIRHIADTAPTPTPAQRERLAGLLRDPELGVRNN